MAAADRRNRSGVSEDGDVAFNDDTGDFAFGDNDVFGVSCPAKSSDLWDELEEHEWLPVAERYDEIVKARFGLDEGTLPADTAAEIWYEAIEYHRELKAYRSAAKGGKRIAEDVF